MSETARVAGSDTREALATPSVRASAAAAALIAGPAWASTFGAPGAWRRFIAMPHDASAWFAVALAAAGVAAGIAAWRYAPDPHTRTTPSGQRRLPPGLGAAATFALGAFIAMGTREGRLMALLLVLAPILAGWTAGTAARTAVAACVPGVSSAAAGIVVAGGLTGLLFAGHIGLVARGSGFPRAAGWSFVYALLASVNLVRAARSLSSDRARIAARVAVLPAERNGDGKQAALAVESLVVAFGSTTVLDGISLGVRSGELVALVGGNGAGKSTLLRTAAGFNTPHSGRIIVSGDDVTTLLPEERATAGLAFVSGARPIFPDLSVIDNLRVAAYRTHPTGRLFSAATASVLELVPVLAKRQRAKAGVLSGGEQRLLAVAQTLFRRPVALLADELTLGLDVDSRLAVLDLLRLLADQGIAVVVVDHDLPALLPRADRAVLLAHGSSHEYADAASLLSRRSDLLPATFLSGAAG